MAEDGGIKQVAYPVVTILAFLVAGYLLYSNFTSKPINEMSDKQDSQSPFACNECQWTGMLTARQIAEQQKKGQEVGRAGAKDGSGGKTSLRTLTIMCPQCSKVAAVPANQCGECLTVYMGDTCPKCGPPKDGDGGAAPAAESSGGDEGRRRR